ncbi:MAG: hypothetical protein WD802_00850 [Gemmatimonadaceae bacterium]
MISWRGFHLGAFRAALVLAGVASLELHAQERARTSGRDTTVVANPRFEAGGFHRFFLGHNYRDQWSTPITVPFLDLRSFGGGLRPTETGGGRQTRNLRFEARNGLEYAFRSVNKGLMLPEVFENTVIWDLIADERSGLHPTAPLPGSPILTAAGVLHPTPRLYVMPNDPLLGKFREEFAGLLGTMEERPRSPDNSHGFAKAVEIIDSEELLKRINRAPTNHVDGRTLLAARLVDMLLNDNDRHPDQWYWARMSHAADAPLIPIARDRDKALHSVEGLLPRLARFAKPSIITFDSSYANVKALISASLDFDRRLLGGLERPVWDSVSAALVRKISDPVIDEAVRRMPREYSPSFPEISGKLKARRDSLPSLAARYYEVIAAVADIHGTDADELAAVNRSGDGVVEVSIQSRNRAPHFRRRFNAAETSEIRVYLHGGNDFAVVRGEVAQSIPVRIIGGDGTNRLVDSSSVGGRSNPTHLYESGTVRGTRYTGDSGDEREIAEAQIPFDRRPWSLAYGELAPAHEDYGTKMVPFGSIGSGHGLGIVPQIGIARYKYGFRRVPYASMIAADLAYSTAINGFDAGLEYDTRFESSSFHVPVSARMSQLEVVEFRGLGNDVPDIGGSFYDVRQRQWSLRAALGFSPNWKSDISLGPIVRYTSTDSTANRFISQQQPYGFGGFAQAGVQLKFNYDTRTQELPDISGGTQLLKLEKDYPALWGKMDFGASAYPGILDAASAYQKIAGVAKAYLTVPFLTRPVLALRAGGEKLYGSFPYFDAAFIGGSRSLRTEHRQRFAGDASLFGTTELRIPIANFPFFLPWDIGAIGFVDFARVYVDGASPGGWHQGSGGGIWISLVRPDLGVTIMRTNNPERRTLTSLGFAF